MILKAVVKPRVGQISHLELVFSTICCDRKLVRLEPRTGFGIKSQTIHRDKLVNPWIIINEQNDSLLDALQKNRITSYKEIVRLQRRWKHGIAFDHEHGYYSRDLFLPDELHSHNYRGKLPGLYKAPCSWKKKTSSRFMNVDFLQTLWVFFNRNERISFLIQINPITFVQILSSSSFIDTR